MKRLISALSSLCLAATSLLGTVTGISASAAEVKADAPAGTIVYDLVPHGKTYEAADEGSKGNNVVTAEPNEELTIDWTIKHDQGTAGLQMTLDFSQADYQSAKLGKAYMALPQFNDNTGTKGEIVYTFGQDEEETAKDGSTIYSFNIKAPATGSVTVGEKTGSNVFNKVISREDVKYDYIFHGLTVKVDDSTPGSSEPKETDPPKQTTPAKTVDITDTIIYNLVPQGKEYTAAADNSTGNNVYNAKAGEEITVDWTVKKDQGVAGIQMTLDFSEVDYTSAKLGKAYMALPQFNDKTGTKGEIVYTFGQDEEETAKDGAVIYSFNITAPKSGSASIGEKTGSNIFNKVISREDKTYKYVFHGLDIVVDGTTPSSTDEPKQTTPAQTVDITDTIIYNLVPQGKDYTAAADNSTGNNVYNAKAGEAITVDWTVKKDQGVAGIQMTLDFSEVEYTSAKLGKAYMALPQFNDNTGTKGEIVYTFGQDEEETAKDGAVIYSFNITAPQSGTASIGEKTGSNIFNKVISREDKTYKYVFHGLDIVVGGTDEPKQTTPAQSVDSKDMIIYNLVPNGLKYTAAADDSTGNNVVEVAPNAELTIDWTVKQDKGVAGIQMTLDFSEVDYTSAKLGKAYMALPQFNDKTGTKGEIVYTFGQDEEETAKDGAVIYSFNITAPASGKVSVGEKTGSNIFNKVISREDKAYQYLFHGLDIVVKDDSPIDPTGKIIYNLVPQGKEYTKAEDTTSDPNVVTAQPGEELTVDWTVKQDAKVAGIQMSLDFSQVEYVSAKLGKAYMALPQFNDNTGVKGEIMYTFGQDEEETAKDGAVIYSFNIKVPDKEGEYVIDERPGQDNKAISREDKSYPYIFHGLKIVAAKDVTTTTPVTTTTTTPTTTVTTVVTNDNIPAGSVNWKIADVKAEPGATVQVPVTVKGDGGTAGIVAEFKFDSALTYEGIEWADGYTGTATVNKDQKLVVWADANGADQKAKDNAVVLNINFKAPTAAGKYDVDFVNLEVTNTSGNALTVTKEAGSVTVEGTAGKSNWVIGKETVAPGAKVQVPVTVNGDEGTSGFVAEFAYDSHLQFDGFEWAGGYKGKATLNDKELVAVWADANGENQQAKDGDTVLYLNFTAPTEAGEYPVEFKSLEATAANGAFLTLTQENGAVIVTDPDAGSAEWIIGKKVVEGGAQAKVPVTVNGDTGTAGFIVEFGYDSALSFDGFEWADGYTGKVTINKDELVLVWADANGKNQKAADGATVAYLLFTAPDAAGEYPVSFKDLEATNENGSFLALTKEDGAVIVKDPEAGSAKWDIGEKTVGKGATAKVPVTVSGDTGTAGFVVEFAYDHNLEFTGIEWGDAYTGRATINTNDQLVVWADANGEQQKAKDDAVVLYLNFIAPDYTGQFPVKFINLEATDKAGINLVVEQDNGWVEVVDDVTTTVSSTSDTTPTTSGEESTPTTSGEESTPTTSGNETTPTTSGNETTPTTSGNETTPTTSGNETTPTTSGNETTPTTSGNETTPTTSGNETTPTTSGNETTPTTSGDVTTPTTSGNETTPTTSGVETTPSSVETSETAPVNNGHVVYQIAKVEGVKGTTVAVPVYVWYDEGTAGFTMEFAVPDGFKISGIEYGDAYTGANNEFQWKSDEKVLVWASADGANQKAKSGATIATLYIDIPANAADDTDYPVTFVKDSVTVSDTERNLIAHEEIDGNIHVLPVETGDIVFGIGETSGTPGSKVDIPLTVMFDKGTNGFEIQLDVPDGLTIDDFTIDPDSVYAKNGKFEWDPTTKTLKWTSNDGKNVIPTPGTKIGTFSGTISKDAVPGTEYTIDVTNAKATNEAGGSVKVSSIAGKVVVDKIPEDPTTTTITSDTTEPSPTTPTTSGEETTPTTSGNETTPTTSGNETTPTTSGEETTPTTSDTTPTTSDVTTTETNPVTSETSFKVVTSLVTEFEKPTRVNYWSHDPRSFKESGGLRGLKFNITLYKYYINDKNLFVNEEGLPISGTPYNEADGIPENVKPIAVKTLDATAYTHPMESEDGPLKVWTNEIKAQFGDNYTAADELSAKHANKYPVKAYYFPNEQTDPDFNLNNGEPLYLGDWGIYIGVKGDVNLDNIADVQDAQLVLNYYTAKVVAHKDIDKINVDRPVDEEFEGVDRLCYYLGDVKYKNNDGTMADPTSLDVEDAQMILNYYTSKYVAKKTETNWEGVVGYDLLDSFYGGVEE